GSTDARCLGASPHAVRIIETAEQLAATGGPDYDRVADRYGPLGSRGHVLTKTRRYSTTFGALRRARQAWRRTPIAARNSGEDIRQAGEAGEPGGRLAGM